MNINSIPRKALRILNIEGKDVRSVIRMLKSQSTNQLGRDCDVRTSGFECAMRLSDTSPCRSRKAFGLVPGPGRDSGGDPARLPPVGPPKRLSAPAEATGITS